jgi:hypothetical protein
MDMLGVKVTTHCIRMIEVGQKCPTLFTLKRLSTVLATCKITTPL